MNYYFLSVIVILTSDFKFERMKFFETKFKVDMKIGKKQCNKMRKLRTFCLFLQKTFKRLLEKLFGPWAKVGLIENPGEENVFNLQNQNNCMCKLLSERNNYFLC